MDVETNKIPYGQKAITLTNLISRVRRYMRDHSQLNRLIAGVESSDEDIMLAIDETFSDWNMTPPFTRKYDYDNPPPFTYLLHGIVVALLESKGLLESRNARSFNDGGISYPADQDQRTQSWLQHFFTRYQMERDRFKVAENIEMAWGVSLSSEYVLINNVGFYSGVY